MKDKLEKSGHGRAYFRRLLLVKSCLIALGVCTVLAIPIGISYNVAETAKAEREKSSSEERKLSDILETEPKI